MKWSEFLAEMEKQGVQPDDLILYIDFGMDERPKLEVTNQAEFDAKETYHNGQLREREIIIS